MARIWHLSSNRWNSAITEYALQAAMAMKEAGHDTLFTPLAESPAAKRVAAYNMRSQPLNNFGLNRLSELDHLAREFKPDLFFTYGGPETVLAQAMRLRGWGQGLLRFRGHELKRKDLTEQLRQRVGLAGVDAIITPGERLAQELRQLTSKNVYPVILGLDESVYCRRPGDGTPRPEILIFGRLDPIKGHREFMRIFAKVIADERLANLNLHIAGAEENLSFAELAALAGELGIFDRVRFSKGRLEDVRTLMSQTLIGCVPSLGSETICRVAQEFLLCGTPVLVSGAGSLDEVLFDGAGLSYRGLNEADTVELVRDFSLATLQAELGTREARAASARANFSRGKMAALLEAASRSITSLEP